MQVKNKIHILVNVLFSGALLLFLASTGADERLPEIFARMDRVLCGGFVLLSLVGIVFRAFRYRVMLTASGDECPYSEVFFITGVRNVLVDLLPARLGEAVLVYLFSRAGVRVMSSIALFILTLLCDLIVLGLLVLPLAFLDPPHQWQYALRFLVLILIVVVPMILWQLPRVVDFCAKIFPTHKFISESSETFHSLVTTPLLVKILSLTVVLRAAKYGGLYLLFRAIMDPAAVQPASRVVASFIGAEASASLPASGFMGFGAYEVVWGTILSGSVETATSGELLASVFAIHLVTQLLACAVGALCMAGLFFYPPKASEK